MSYECTDAQMLACRFGESLDSEVLSSAYSALQSCDLFMTIGTSSVVHPAAGFAAQVRYILHSSNLGPCAFLSPLPCGMCPVPCSLCPVLCTLFPLPYALAPVPCPMCPVPCALHPVPFALHPFPCALHFSPCALQPVAYVVCPPPIYSPVLPVCV